MLFKGGQIDWRWSHNHLHGTAKNISSGLANLRGDVLQHQLVKVRISYRALQFGVLIQPLRLIYPHPRYYLASGNRSGRRCRFTADCWRCLLYVYIHFNLQKRLKIYSGRCFTFLVRSNAPLVSVCPIPTGARFTGGSNVAPKPRRPAVYLLRCAHRALQVAKLHSDIHY